eukprot:scaffold25065_cov68-Phaeocystis_antarctica.AAC.5
MLASRELCVAGVDRDSAEGHLAASPGARPQSGRSAHASAPRSSAAVSTATPTVSSPPPENSAGHECRSLRTHSTIARASPGLVLEPPAPTFSHASMRTSATGWPRTGQRTPRSSCVAAGKLAAGAGASTTAPW